MNRLFKIEAIIMIGMALSLNLLMVGTGAGYEPITVFITGSTESWTRIWKIQDTLYKNRLGLKAGFHRSLAMTSKIGLPGNARGILCIVPLSNHQPAVLTANHVKIKRAVHVFVRAAATRFPKGKWEMAMMIDGQLHSKPVTIGSQWTTVEFDLTPYRGRTVDLAIEARAVGIREPSAFIDEIIFSQEEDKKEGSHNAEQHFDAAYNAFLNALRKNEEIRQFRLIDRALMDKYYRNCQKQKYRAEPHEN